MMGVDMTAKEYLRRVRHLDSTISAKLEQIETLHAQVTKTTSVLSDMPRSGGEQDRLAKTIAKIVDLKKRLRDEIEEYIELKEEAIKLIDSMSDGRHRLVLTYRYIRKNVGRNSRGNALHIQMGARASWTSPSRF